MFLILGNGWRYDAKYIPPYQIAADGYRDMGSRFVDVNGDGAADFVFNRYVNSKLSLKGAYLGEYKHINFVLTNTSLWCKKLSTSIL